MFDASQTNRKSTAARLHHLIHHDDGSERCSAWSERLRNVALLIVAVFGLTAGAQASLISRDMSAAGDTLLTYDSASGLEWLDVSYTVGRTADSVLGDSGLSSFRFATKTEVDALWRASGATGPFIYDPYTESYPENFAGAKLLVDLLGCTSDVLGQPCDGLQQNWHFGRYESQSGLNGFNLGLVDYFGPPDYRDGTGAMLLDIGSDYPSFFERRDIGNYLVREATVPLPGTLPLFLIGVTFLFVGRMRGLPRSR